MSLREQVLQAYGGGSRWREARGVRAVVSAGGWAFRMKGRGALRRVPVELEVHAPRVRLGPFDRRGHLAVLDGTAARLERGGEVLLRRDDPRARFPRRLWWDALDFGYFATYAIWNYATFPALLLRDDIAWSQPAEWVLEGRFPPHLPTHCAIQQYRIDPATRLLAQYDYTADVFGQWAKAAHAVLEHARDSDGVPYPCRRRVTMRRPDGTARSWPVMVWIQVHELRLSRA